MSMPVRDADAVLGRLEDHAPNLWIDGKPVGDPTTHPSTANACRALAALYGMQSQPDLVDTMTFTSPSSGDRVGMSFIVPETREDLERRSAMHQVWANAHLGFMGRTPDYLNVNVMAAGMAADFFARNDPRFGPNMANYFELVREQDLALTHALTNPQVDRSKRDSELADPYIALGVVRETSDGIIVRGARMLATLPISDEILIFPSTVLQRGEDMNRYAMSFAVPNDTPGLSFQCREPLDIGRSHADHPLGSRFDELDAMVYFDDVLVPWERVFLMNDADVANRAYAETGAVLHMAHQVVNLKIAKTEAILGTMQAAVDMIGTGHYQHVQEMIAEAIIVLEIMKALRVASEAGATINEYGVLTPLRGPLDAARNYYPQMYQRLVEILRMVTSSGLIMIPTEADFDGPMAPSIEKYLGSVGGNAEDRVRLMRLAWDMTISAFGGRQKHYETFFFGDPVRMKQALYNVYDRSAYVERVRNFVADTTWPV